MLSLDSFCSCNAVFTLLEKLKFCTAVGVRSVEKCRLQATKCSDYLYDLLVLSALSDDFCIFLFELFLYAENRAFFQSAQEQVVIASKL